MTTAATTGPHSPRNIRMPCSSAEPPRELTYASANQKNQVTANAIRKNGAGLYMLRASIGSLRFVIPAGGYSGGGSKSIIHQIQSAVISVNAPPALPVFTVPFG